MFKNNSYRLPSVDWWLWGGLTLTGLVSIPILAVCGLALFPEENIWPHLIRTVLPDYCLNTVLLMFGNACGVLIIGVSSAWLVSCCSFPGRRFFEWSLLLPLAVPAYIVAFVYTDIFEYAGPIQSALREINGWDSRRDYWFPNIRSIWGAMFVMSFVLYPYVYLLARASFQRQSAGIFDAGRTLGKGPWRAFFLISLPLARPAIVAGVALAMMETIADFGTVDFFAVRTLTLAIFNVWLGMGNAGGAAQVALVALGFVVLLISLELIGRGGRSYQSSSSRSQTIPRYRLSTLPAGIAWILCALPICIGFLIPVVVLLRYALQLFEESWSNSFLILAWNSFVLAGITAFVTVIAALFLCYGRRFSGRTFALLSRVVVLGYAVPGAVLAIGVLIPFAWFDNFISDIFLNYFGFSTGLIFSGSIFCLIFAYVVRFLAIAFTGVDASLGKIGRSMDLVARTLGSNRQKTLWKIHLPLIRGGVVAAAILVFVDTMKELPATLILRPFNFDTLATHVYQLASDELLEQSALAAITIVLVGILPVFLLSKAMVLGQATVVGVASND